MGRGFNASPLINLLVLGVVAGSCVFFGLTFYSIYTITWAEPWSLAWVNFNPDCNAAVPQTPKTGNSFLMHIFFMALAFGLFSPIGAVSYYFFHDMCGVPYAVTKWIHGLIKTGGLVCSVLGFVEMYYNHGAGCPLNTPGGAGGPHFQSTHSYIGICLLAIYWGVWPMAVAVFSPLRRLLGLSPRLHKRLLNFHIYLGSMTTLLGLATCITGILAFIGLNGPYGATPPQYWFNFNNAALVAFGVALALSYIFSEGRKPAADVTPLHPRLGIQYSAPLLENTVEEEEARDGWRRLAKTFTADEVAMHSTEGDCWIVVHGKVYDVTGFLPNHPGGKRHLLQFAGKVADEGFDQIHNEDVLLRVSGKLLGALGTEPRRNGLDGLAAFHEGPDSPQIRSRDGAGSDTPVFLNQRRQSLVLGQKTNISHDVVRFRFTLPLETRVLGLPVGKHIKLFAPVSALRRPAVEGQWNGRADPEANLTEIERKYTPTTSERQGVRIISLGYVDLVIKVYKGGLIDAFPDGGKMSQYLNSLSVGAQVDISGPWGANEYLGRGVFKVGVQTLRATKVGMLAGGTGITPMLQVSTGFPLMATDGH
jgi:hypothetical protein